ncbi:uncharacterized protein V1513DRAFT_371912 [Lipomyces chichibuensis]|uniref:uncharacterized protein n=1 Tax=Lipomyces chichibuensis TaxID=1546026 RepID=UPI003342F4F1
MSSHDVAAAETAALPSQKRYRHQQVTFVPEAQLEETLTTAVTRQDQGQSVSSFYSSLVGISTTTNTADSALSKSRETTPPRTSIPNQLTLPHLNPPIMRLPVDENNAGHRYLVRYGWQPLQREGLGQKGREGRRVPLKTELRPDNVGVGAKISKNKIDQKEDNKPKKITKGKRKAQEKQARLRDREDTQRLYNEIMR